MNRPALWTAQPGCGGRPVGHFALAAVKRGEVLAAPPDHPDHALTVYGRMAGAAYLRRLPGGWAVDFSLARLRRVRPAFHARQPLVVAAPCDAVLVVRVDADLIATELDALVLLRIGRRIRFRPLRDCAVCVGVYYGRTPSLRRFRVFGFVPG